MLRGKGITLRELRTSDAASLLALLTTEEVTRFISPPPTTIEGFERFIQWAQREREAGRYACFAVVPEGYDTAVGLFQVRQLDPTSTLLASIASRRGRRCRTAGAMARSERLALFRRAS